MEPLPHPISATVSPLLAMAASSGNSSRRYLRSLKKRPCAAGLVLLCRGRVEWLLCPSLFSVCICICICRQVLCCSSPDYCLRDWSGDVNRSDTREGRTEVATGLSLPVVDTKSVGGVVV